MRKDFLDTKGRKHEQNILRHLNTIFLLHETTQTKVSKIINQRNITTNRATYIKDKGLNIYGAPRNQRDKRLKRKINKKNEYCNLWEYNSHIHMKKFLAHWYSQKQIKTEDR